MKLPNPDKAVVDIEKLRDYCLSFEHPRGRHKARVFQAVLGLTFEQAGDLRQGLLAAALTQTATPVLEDGFGQRFVIDFEMNGPRGRAWVRSIWIVKVGEDFARLVTCFAR